MDVLEDWITRLSRLNTVAIEACCSEVGMTASEVSVLTMLSRARSPLNPTRLKVLVIQSPGGLTKTLRRLEDAGYIRRLADPDDRRSLLVELTTAGRKASGRAAKLVRAHYAQLLGAVNPAERSTLTKLVRQLVDELETMSVRPTSTPRNR